jgi:DNA-binding MarR family transcriptional regulator
MDNKKDIYEEALKLDNQICFPLYAASRLIVRKYRPMLEEIGLTYPQYLVMMVLWENKKINIKDLGQKLYLDSGTLTPLLKRLESSNLVIRERYEKDERTVIISLTEEGKKLKEKAKKIPASMIEGCCDDSLDFVKLRETLNRLIEVLKK